MTNVFEKMPGHEMTNSCMDKKPFGNDVLQLNEKI